MIKAKDARIITKPEDIVLIAGMRSLKYCGNHCTSAPQNQPVQETLDYWERHNKWSVPGYNYIITANGTIYELSPINKPTNGIKGFNSNTVHICTTGGIDAKGNEFDNRTPAQIASQIMLIKRLKELLPNLIFKGHRDFSTDKNGNGIIERWEFIKNCPSYDFASWASSVGLDKAVTPIKIIYKVNTPLIKNDTVKAIQNALGIKADGVYGVNTETAVKWYQKSKGLNPDGIVGPKTAELLKVKI